MRPYMIKFISFSINATGTVVFTLVSGARRAERNIEPALVIKLPTDALLE